MKVVVLLVTVTITLLEGSVVSKSDDGPRNNIPAQISILLDSGKNLNITNKDKPTLRYGFQKTQACQVFEKAFLCIRKCLDLGYDIANADKNCHCMCKNNRVIAQYKGPKFGPTKWKSGAPTTSPPSWVKKQSTKLSVQDSPLNDFEIYGDVPIPETHAMNADISTYAPDKGNETNLTNGTTKQEPNESQNVTVNTETHDISSNTSNEAFTNSTTIPDPNKANNETVSKDPNEANDETVPKEPNQANNETVSKDLNKPNNTTTAHDPRTDNNSTVAQGPNEANNATASQEDSVAQNSKAANNEVATENQDAADATTHDTNTT